MTTRRTMAALLLAVLILATPAVAVAGAAGHADATEWSWLGGWLAGLGEHWQEALGLLAASEGGTDGEGTTTPDEPAPPGGKLGPWISPDGAADEGPDPEVNG